MNCLVRKLLAADVDKLKELLLVYEAVFEWQNFVMPSDIHLQNMLMNPQHFVFIAMIGDEVVGGLTAYVLPEFESENSLVYIYDLAVQTEHQRQGFGGQLIQGVRSYCAQQPGLTEVFVQADEEDEYAVDFYRKTEGKEMKVRQFSYAL